MHDKHKVILSVTMKMIVNKPDANPLTTGRTVTAITRKITVNDSSSDDSNGIEYGNDADGSSQTHDNDSYNNIGSNDNKEQ